MTINKETKLYSIVYLKRPPCHYGVVFPAKNPFQPQSMLAMLRRCPGCQHDFVNAPGFYSGALWTSCLIVIGILVLMWLKIHTVLHLPASHVFINGAFIALIFQPAIMRLGRAIRINLFDYCQGRQR